MREIQRWQEESRTSRKPETSKEIFKSYAGEVIDFGELEIGKKIGHGGFGDVYFAEWRGTVVVVKKLRVQRIHQKRLKQFKEEISIFCQLDHPNIIKFLGACIVTPNICMVMEYMEASLYDKIHIDEHEFSEEEKTSIVRQIAEGLVYLHSKDIAHCDMKSTNILVEISEPVVAKITDFGLSIMKNDLETSSSSKVQNVGTPRYSAPEILRGELLKVEDMKKADMYSYGLLVFEIFSEEEPFSDMNLHQLHHNVGKGNYMPSLEEVNMNAYMAYMVRKCWERTPSERPTARVFLDNTAGQF